MYQWYARSAECYVHLSDFALSLHERQAREEHGEDAWFSWIWPTLSSRFRDSSWFTRGWTLQELLAPEMTQISFFDANWYCIGSLGSLLDDVGRVTGIPRNVLMFDRRLIQRRPTRGAQSVAQTMSWASRRRTSRGEDIAYCLLGLFNINMPLLYGEGAENAFYRLQIEIMKTSDDESLFAWTSNQQESGALAPSPACFADCWNIIKGEGGMMRRPYAMTNKGLEISVPKFHLQVPGSIVKFPIQLDCFRSTDSAGIGGEARPLTLQLRCSVLNNRCGAFREDCHTVEGPEGFTLRDLYKGLSGETLVIHVFDPRKNF